MRRLRVFAALGAALVAAVTLALAPAGEASACAGFGGDNQGLDRSPAFTTGATSYFHKHAAPRFGFSGRIVFPNLNAGHNASPNSVVSSWDHQIPGTSQVQPPGCFGS
jgi:hypothetical protein